MTARTTAAFRTVEMRHIVALHRFVEVFRDVQYLLKMDRRMQTRDRKRRHREVQRALLEIKNRDLIEFENLVQSND